MVDLLVIGGERVTAAEGKTLEVIEPSTAAPMAEVAEAGPADAERAVGVALRAFEESPWPRTSARERGRVLTKASLIIRERFEDLARLEARNGGKPISAARGEIDIVANVFEYWGGAANKIFGETIPIVPPGIDVTLREPVGVCVLITPWNFPLAITSWKVAPALACGNTAIVKPASQTPLTALAMAEILREAGLPGRRSQRSARAWVDGRRCADRRPARLQDQLYRLDRGRHPCDEGGREPHHPCLAGARREVGWSVIFADADLDVCVEKSIWAVFDNAGQDCCARSRAFVERPSLPSSSSNDSRERAESIAVGEPLDEATEMGPLISQGQRQTSLDYIELGIGEGARRVTGGDVPDSPGFYLRPAVLADVRNEMRVARRRSSARWPRSSRSTPKRRRSAWRTNRRTGSPDRSGPRTSGARSACRRRSERA